jgi:peroxiredoxin
VKGQLIRNMVIGLVIAVAVAGAIWAGGSKEKASQPSSSKSAVDTSKKKEEQPVSQGKVSREERPQEGFRAPDFTLKTMDGKEVRLSDNEGKPALINFWASWCPPCKAEMPHIQEAYEQYKREINFHMVNLAVQDNPDEMKKYIQKEKFTFPILLDETGEVAQEYNVTGIPQTVIVNTDGEIVKVVIGAMTKEQLQELLKRVTSG